MSSLLSPLLSATRSSAIGSDVRHVRCSNVCVATKPSWYVLVTLAVVNAVGFGPIFYFITTPAILVNETIALIAYGFVAVALLVFPAFGLAGEVCCRRYKTIVFGVILITVGALGFAPLYVVSRETSSSLFHFNFGLMATFLIILPGVGMIQATALQYGVDQLDFASSEVLSSFVYWYYWAIFGFIAPLVAIGTLASVYILIICFVGIATVLLSFLILFNIFCFCVSLQLRTDLRRKMNPLKLIWQVMLFSKRRKFPLLRSAFTYNEVPSRLDLAKQRYGGPFTTEEVEDVKSFWRILLVLGSLTGFQMQDDTLITMTEVLLLKQQFCSYYLISPWAVSSFVIAVAVPAYQLFVRPYFTQYMPKMLTRIGMGLVVVLVSVLLTTLYSVWITPAADQFKTNVSQTVCSDLECETVIKLANISVCSALRQVTVNGFRNASTFCNMSVSSFTTSDYPLPSLYLLVIPQALNGLAHLLVFLTTLEFIIAQAPCTMQGFLIGLWYAMQSVNLGITMIGYSSCAAFYWEYYAAKTLLVFLSFLLFIWVSRSYKYRRRNEEADVNTQQAIEDVFERNLDREVEYLRNELHKKPTIAKQPEQNGVV